MSPTSQRCNSPRFIGMRKNTGAAAAAIVALGLGVAATAQAQTQTFHEATETDRGVDLETGDKVKLTSKRHVNYCLNREPDAKLVDKQRLYLVVDPTTENLCSQFYVFATKDVVENLGACSYAFPLTPEALTVETGKKKGASLTQVIVDNRAIMNPDPAAAAAVPPTIHGTLDWVIELKDKKGALGKVKGPIYGELSYGLLVVGSESETTSALINDGSIKASDPKDVALVDLDIDCSCGDGLWDEGAEETCDGTAPVTGCEEGFQCNALCSKCQKLPAVAPPPEM